MQEGLFFPYSITSRSWTGWEQEKQTEAAVRFWFQLLNVLWATRQANTLPRGPCESWWGGGRALPSQEGCVPMGRGWGRFPSIFEPLPDSGSYWDEVRGADKGKDGEEGREGRSVSARACAGGCQRLGGVPKVLSPSGTNRRDPQRVLMPRHHISTLCKEITEPSQLPAFERDCLCPPSKNNYGAWDGWAAGIEWTRVRKSLGKKPIRNASRVGIASPWENC